MRQAAIHLVITIGSIATIVAALVLLQTRRAYAYIEVPYTLGKLVNDSTTIVHMRIEKVDREKNTIVYRKIEDIKGKHPTDEIKHNIAKSGFHAREWQTIMAWAEVGKTAVFMHNNSASETCMDNYWYQCYPGGEWWNMFHAEPFLLRSFAGKPDKLVTAIKQMMAGQEVVVPCMVDGDKNAIALRTAKIQRIKASLAIQDYNAQRDFVGWGGEELRPISDMPGFTHMATLISPSGRAIGLASVQLDGDTKTDVTLWNDAGLSVLQNAGMGSFNEISLGIPGGARSASWFDYNGSGKQSLLLATTSGPKLFTNLGNGKFRDDSAALPKREYWHLTAATWIEMDDGPAMLLADGFAGLQLFISKTPKMTETDAAPPQAVFADGTDAARLGSKAPADKGDLLLVADVNNDKRQDVLFMAGKGLLLLNRGKHFEVAQETGIQITTGGLTPAFADMDGDGQIDLVVPQKDGVKLLKNVGRGVFKDATPAALSRILNATSVSAADYLGTGRSDLFVGCTRGVNRFFANTAAGLQEQTQKLGLDKRIFNTKALIAADFNGDRMSDLMMLNIGQDPVLLMGNPEIRASQGVSK